MVYSLFEQKKKKNTCPISLGWNKPDDCIFQNKLLSRVSTHKRKLPVTKSNDFLW